MTPDPHPVPQTSVTDSPVAHVQSEQRPDLFRRGAAGLALFFTAVIVAVLIGMPIFLMVMFWSPWLLFTLIFVASGVLLLWKTVAAVRRTAWHARHRSSFALREAGSETTEWNTVGVEAPWAVSSRWRPWPRW